MSGHRSRDKGARTERTMVRLLQARGIAAEKVSGMYKPSADVNAPLLGVDRAVKVKCRAAGFDGRDALIVKADPQEPLFVLRMSLAAEIAKATPGTATANEAAQIAKPTPSAAGTDKAATGTYTECDKGRAA